MTDRFSALIVTLNQDMREDDAQALISAISQLRSVRSVKGHVSNVAELVAEQRVRLQAHEQLIRMARDILNP